MSAKTTQHEPGMDALLGKLAIGYMIADMLEGLEILLGSLETKENYPKIKNELPFQLTDDEFASLVDLYLSCFSDEERAERKRLCALQPIGILKTKKKASRNDT